MDKTGQQNRARILFKKLVDCVPGINYLNDRTQRDYILGLAGKARQ